MGFGCTGGIGASDLSQEPELERAYPVRQSQPVLSKLRT